MQTKLVIACLATAIVLFAAAATAQQPSTSVPNYKGAKALTTPPAIPNMPAEYPGQPKYKSIIERTSDEGREYSITFLTKDREDQVTQFYREALRTSGWTISPSRAIMAISARRLSASATITVMLSSDKKMPTQVYVTYREWHPK